MLSIALTRSAVCCPLGGWLRRCQIQCWQRFLSLRSLRPCRSHTRAPGAEPGCQTAQCWHACWGCPDRAGLERHQTRPFGLYRAEVVCQLSEPPSCHRLSFRFSRPREAGPADYLPIPSSTAEKSRSPLEDQLPPGGPSAWAARFSEERKIWPLRSSEQASRPEEAVVVA